MSDSNRVAWTEGLFLRPQHFQQSERFIEKLLIDHTFSTIPYAYGFTKLKIDQEISNLGKVGLAAAQGILPDGTSFDIPNDADIPTPLEIPDETKDAVVTLSVPLRRPNMASMALERNANNALARSFAADYEARDSIAELESVAELKVARLNLGMRLAQDLSPAYCHLNLAKIIEKRADGRIVFDEKFYPTVLDCQVSAGLFGCLNEVHGYLRHRAQELAERVAQPGTKGVAEFADFLLLQLCNRQQPLFAHLATRSSVHPELLYRYFVELSGELATFARKDRRAVEFEAYQHDDLWGTFLPVMEEVRRGLTAIIETSAVAVPLESKGQGYYVANVQDVHLLRNAVFVLSANAQMPAETLRARFPRETQIGPREKIRALVDSHLPGIVLHPLPVAPRQIPYHAGYTYFELEKSRRTNESVDYWQQLEESRMFIMHVAGDFPELALSLWAIRNS